MLQPAETGKHKGMYAYRMQTDFLYYVKNKVVESPAVYFIVDVENKITYYAYLSDGLLTRLDFENKKTITFWFNKSNILEEDKFYHEMLRIANERNEKFFMRPEEDIEKLQDAVYGLNTLLDTDFKKIKDALFPDLWRFGIANSSNADFEMQFVSRKDNEVHVIHPESSSVYGLYPQMKGKINPEIKEFTGAENYFTQINIGGQISPEEYVQKVIHKIIRNFCENPPLKLLPSIVLMELVYEQNEKIKELLDGNGLGQKELLARYYYLLDYLFRLLTADDLDEQEKTFREKITEDGTIRRGSIDFNNSEWIDIRQPMLRYINKVQNTVRHKINIDLVLNVLQKKWIKYFLIMEELASRDVSSIPEVWGYRMEDLFGGTQASTELIQSIIIRWWKDLPAIYDEFYSNVFDTDKYRYKLKAIFSFEHHEKNYPCNLIGAISKLYKPDDGISIQYSPVDLSVDFTEEDKQNGIISIISSLQPAEFVRDSQKTLFYDGIRCWMYQGICNAMGIKAEGITIGWTRRLLFE